MSVTSNYSGVAVDQNGIASGSIDWRNSYSSQTIYQTFYLPSNYELGSTKGELRYPDLSGFQVMVTVDQGYAFSASLDYTMDYFVEGSGWYNLATGTAIGCHTDGQCWFDVIFPQSVPVNSLIASSLIRFGITTTPAKSAALQEPVTTVVPNTYLVETNTVNAVLGDETPYQVVVNGVRGFLYKYQGTVTYTVQQGVGNLWYTEEPTLTSGQAYQSDCQTPLLGSGTNASLEFRVLSLSADNGVDFLGNNYRSCVIQNVASDPSAYWVSLPQPSQFAVVSRYFDVRPVPSTPEVGLVNLVTNPNFSWDVAGQQPSGGWGASGAFNSLAGTLNGFTVDTRWGAYEGHQACRVTASNVAVNADPGAAINISVNPGSTYTASITFNILNMTPGFWAQIYIAAGSVAASGNRITSLGVNTSTVVWTVPPGVTTATVYALTFNGGTATGSIDFLFGGVIATLGDTPPTYFDGDNPGCQWLGQAGQSISAQMIDPEPAGSAVIDGVRIDPLTPNMAFNVYYSLDDSYNNSVMTESNWEQKLWTFVKTFTCTQDQLYMFPGPITAKYVKIEFTNLPAQTYSQGPFGQPVVYKKFPTWVADFFILQMQQPSFIANTVNVQNDALTFAYDYYLDDLEQKPDMPLPPANPITLNSFFSQNSNLNMIDAQTLSQISLVLSSFQVPTGSLVDPSTLLGGAAQNIVSNISTTPSQTVEVPNQLGSISYSAVSTSQRGPLVFEQSLPVMYFYVTSRHSYKQLSATFDSGKAYYAGTNSISFFRQNYAVSLDSDLYIEPGGDLTNAFQNDFVVTNGVWTTYAG